MVFSISLRSAIFRGRKSNARQRRLTIVDVRVDGRETEVFPENLDLFVVFPRLHLLKALFVRQNQTFLHHSGTSTQLQVKYRRGFQSFLARVRRRCANKLVYTTRNRINFSFKSFFLIDLEFSDEQNHNFHSKSTNTE